MSVDNRTPTVNSYDEYEKNGGADGVVGYALGIMDVMKTGAASCYRHDDVITFIMSRYDLTESEAQQGNNITYIDWRLIIYNYLSI